MESASWIENLPKEIGDFRLRIGNEQEQENKQVYYFSYENSKGWSWSALYDNEVEDYTVHINLGLFQFVDISFIRTDESIFVKNIVEHAENSIIKTLVEPWRNFDLEYRRKGIDKWDYEEVLPKEMNGFTRYIAPDNAIKVINGSYLVGQYKKEKEHTGLLLFYNVFREEFFCELRYKNYPMVTHLLDAKSILQLESALKLHLNEILERLHQEIENF